MIWMAFGYYPLQEYQTKSVLDINATKNWIEFESYNMDKSFISEGPKNEFKTHAHTMSSETSTSKIMKIMENETYLLLNKRI